MNLFRRHDFKAENSLDWLIANRSGFEIVHSSDKDMPWEVKSIVELAFLLTVLIVNKSECRRSRTLTDAVICDIEHFDWHQLAAFDPSAATVIATVGRFCRLVGAPLPYEPDYLHYLADVRFFDGMDRLPYRQMDLAYSLTRIGIDTYAATLIPSFAQTAAGQGQPIVRYSIGDIYSLTHAIFYLSDIGLSPGLPGIADHEAARLRREIVALTVVLLRIDNVDLLGEVLLCWIMCGVAASPGHRRLFELALRRVAEGARADGAVSPTRQIGGQAAPGFALLYHTTLVAALLFRLERRWARH